MGIYSREGLFRGITVISMIKVSVLNAISIFFINLEIAYVKIMRMKMYVTVLLVNATNARMDCLEEASVQEVCTLMSIINIKLLTVL